VKEGKKEWTGEAEQKGRGAFFFTAATKRPEKLSLGGGPLGVV